MIEASWPDWISAFSSAIGAIGISWGVFTAKSQIEISRRTSNLARRSEVAEKILVLSHGIVSSLHQIRYPLYLDPDAQSRSDPSAKYRNKLDRIAALKDTIDEIQVLGLRLRALGGDPAAFSLIRGILDDIRIIESAAAALILHTGVSNFDQETPSERRESLKELEADVDGSFDENDEMYKRLEGALKDLDNYLEPEMRMEPPIG